MDISKAKGTGNVESFLPDKNEWMSEHEQRVILKEQILRAAKDKKLSRAITIYGT